MQLDKKSVYLIIEWKINYRLSKFQLEKNIQVPEFRASKNSLPINYWYAAFFVFIWSVNFAGDALNAFSFLNQNCFVGFFVPHIYTVCGSASSIISPINAINAILLPFEHWIEQSWARLSNSIANFWSKLSGGMIIKLLGDGLPLDHTMQPSLAIITIKIVVKHATHLP